MMICIVAATATLWSHRSVFQVVKSGSSFVLIESKWFHAVAPISLLIYLSALINGVNLASLVAFELHEKVRKCLLLIRVGVPVSDRL